MGIKYNYWNISRRRWWRSKSSKEEFKIGSEYTLEENLMVKTMLSKYFKSENKRGKCFFYPRRMSEKFGITTHRIGSLIGMMADEKNGLHIKRWSQVGRGMGSCWLVEGENVKNGQ